VYQPSDPGLIPGMVNFWPPTEKSAAYFLYIFFFSRNVDAGPWFVLSAKLNALQLGAHFASCLDLPIISPQSFLVVFDLFVVVLFCMHAIDSSMLK
jgi:hypothetical protein